VGGKMASFLAMYCALRGKLVGKSLMEDFGEVEKLLLKQP